MLLKQKAKADYLALMDTKKIQLGRMSLIAQEDGIVKDVMVWEGTLIGAGVPVATFVSNKRLVAARITRKILAPSASGRTRKCGC